MELIVLWSRFHFLFPACPCPRRVSISSFSIQIWVSFDPLDMQQPFIDFFVRQSLICSKNIPQFVTNLCIYPSIDLFFSFSLFPPSISGLFANQTPSVLPTPTCLEQLPDALLTTLLTTLPHLPRPAAATGHLLYGQTQTCAIRDKLIQLQHDR